MDTVKLEKQVRIVPIICVFLILVLRFIDKTGENPTGLILTIILGIITIASFFFRMYLENKNGHYNPKRYYIFYFFLFISITMFVYQLLKQ